jgi:DNA polymerase III subunit gamma/tau
VPEEPAVPYQALYRRFRPQRFSDVLGQDHVTKALRAAVRDHKTAHAYLFSGPRGTGKTSTARILAMALNCENPQDGEPDGTCASCVAVRQGVSLDVQELDSATNRGIDEMRDLLSRVALGTPGRWKVYIVDEVHQMTSAASSALLKTLEEPPGHVIFVLATTDPQKVLPTIRSRTQHFEFRLLGTDVLSSLLRDVNDKASLHLPSEAIDLVVRRGHGSARDALSALDQVAAAGGVEDEVTAVVDLVDAMADRDPARVLVQVAEAAKAGLDPRRLGTELLEYLRNGFLATRARSLVMLADDAAEQAEKQANRLGAAAIVRAMEIVGQALIDMRDAADPRTTLEVALVRISAPEVDDSRAALLERIERLERLVSAKPESASSAQAPPPAEAPSSAVRSGAAAGPGTALGAHRQKPAPPLAPGPSAQTGSPGSEEPSAEVAARSEAVPTETEPSDLPSREELTLAWGDKILPSLRPAIKVYVAGGRFVSVEDAAVFAVPDRGLLSRAQAGLADMQTALASFFGRPIPVRLVLDDGSVASAPVAPAPSAEEEEQPVYDIADLEDAPAGILSPEQRLMEAFPGAEEV